MEKNHEFVFPWSIECRVILTAANNSSIIPESPMFQTLFTHRRYFNSKFGPSPQPFFSPAINFRKRAVKTSRSTQRRPNDISSSVCFCTKQFLNSLTDIRRRFDNANARVPKRRHFFRSGTLSAGNNCTGVSHSSPRRRGLPGDK